MLSFSCYLILFNIPRTIQRSHLFSRSSPLSFWLSTPPPPAGQFFNPVQTGLHERTVECVGACVHAARHTCARTRACVLRMRTRNTEIHLFFRGLVTPTAAADPDLSLSLSFSCMSSFSRSLPYLRFSRVHSFRDAHIEIVFDNSRRSLRRRAVASAARGGNLAKKRKGR